MKQLFILPLIILVLIGIGWILVFNDLAVSSYFSPKREQVRRETFEQSKAFRDGMVQELGNMRFDYIQANKDHKAALASIIRHRALSIPESEIPTDLKQFIKELP